MLVVAVGGSGQESGGGSGIAVQLEGTHDVWVGGVDAVKVGVVAIVGLDGRAHVPLPDGTNGIALTRLGPVRDEHGDLRHIGPLDSGETKRFGLEPTRIVSFR